MPAAKIIASRLQMNFNSRIYHLSSNQTLYETFKYRIHDSNIIEQKIGDVYLTDFFAGFSSIWERRSNLSSVHLDIIYVNNPPLITVVLNGTERVSGIFGEIFHTLQEKLKFSYALHLQEDNLWGYVLQNGSYSGLFGQIEKGRAVWSIADTTQNLERTQTFDFSIPILNQPRKIMTHRPQEDFDFGSYLAVFSSQFWMALLISAAVLIIILYLNLRQDCIEEELHHNQFSTAFAFTMLSLFCREIFSLKTNWPGKIICLVVVLWGFLISASYNAILTSVLASSRSYPPINSLEDLLNSQDYSLLLKPEGSTRHFFRTAPNDSIGNVLIILYCPLVERASLVSLNK